jgi:hypothetical protein
VKVNAVPDMEPEIVPVNMIAPDAAATDPETEEPACATVHVIVPAPVESAVDPEYTPFRLTVVVGDELGPVGEEDRLQLLSMRAIKIAQPTTQQERDR